MKRLILLIITLFLSACNNAQETTAQNNITLGKTTFDKNCVVCHGKAGVGLTKNWKKPQNGIYPPPPLNGTAHTWHHSPAILLKTINQGGVKLGGVMPGFKDKLNQSEKQALLDYLYSLWPKDIQQKYDKRFK